MKTRIQRLLNISEENAAVLAAKIDQRVVALEETGLSKKNKLKKVLKELGWSSKNIEHFVYGPPKKKPRKSNA
ncbi:MAG: hypothetical protein ABJN69_00920 [Hellea sp.]